MQLWIALPSESRNSPRAFENHKPPLTRFDGGSALVFIGSLLGSTSPVTTHTPLLGAEVRLDPHTSVTLDVDPDFEHGLLVDTGDAVLLEGVHVPKTPSATPASAPRHRTSPTPATTLPGW